MMFLVGFVFAGAFGLKLLDDQGPELPWRWNLVWVVLGAVPAGSTALFLLELRVPPDAPGWLWLLALAVSALAPVLAIAGAGAGPHQSLLRVATVTVALTSLGGPVTLAWMRGAEVFAQVHETAPTVPAECASLTQPLWVHASDLHVAAGPRTREGKDSGLVHLDALARLLDAKRPAWTLITGDLSDGGVEPEWQNLAPWLDKRSGHLLLAPGNHDVVPAYAAAHDPEDCDVDDRPRHLARFVRAAARVQPDVRIPDGRTLAAFAQSEPPRPTHAQFEAQQRRSDQCFSDCINPDAPKMQMPCTNLCINSSSEVRDWVATRTPNVDFWKRAQDSLFPWTDFDAARGLWFIVLDTNARQSAGIGDSAVGDLDPQQRARFDALLRTPPPGTKALIVMGHHAFTRDAADRFLGPARLSAASLQDSPWWIWGFLSTRIETSRSLVEELKAFADRTRLPTFYLHGHRHHSALGDFGALHVEESPDLPSDERGVWLRSADLASAAFCPL
ncbi:MAG: metallophosphoesterase [Deltaproteobacteria bacterium]|nr:metallophosphoesterase [Deltaproteobacteria bacterium]